MKSPNDEWDDLLDGKPQFNSWQEQTFLIRLLSTSTLDEEERAEVVNRILDIDLDYDGAREIAELLLINQLHFSNIPNPSQTDIARFIRKMSNL